MAHGILVPPTRIEPVLHCSRSVDSSFYGSQLFLELINFYFWLLLELHCCVWTFSRCGARPSVVAASLAVGHST